MRKVLIILLVLLIALVVALPAMAGPPCADTGAPGNSEYAQGHIRPLATTGGLGADGHVPGSHHGFSVCNPSGK